MPLPFSTGPFTDRLSGHRLRFLPGGAGNAMVWTGDGWEKTGEWRLLERNGAFFLELSFNYGREETYGWEESASAGGRITAFRLTDSHGRKWEFQLEA